MVEREGIRESTEGTSTEGGVSVGVVKLRVDVKNLPAVQELLERLIDIEGFARHNDSLNAGDEIANDILDAIETFVERSGG
jgi:hypothetical protein